MEQVYK